MSIGDDPLHHGSYRTSGVATDNRALHAAHMRVLSDTVDLPLVGVLFWALFGGFFGSLVGILLDAPFWHSVVIGGLVCPAVFYPLRRVLKRRHRRLERKALLDAEAERNVIISNKLAAARQCGAFDRFQSARSTSTNEGAGS